MNIGWHDFLKSEGLPGLKVWAGEVDRHVRRFGGHSIVLYNQKHDVRTKVGGELVKDGFCLPMSIQWIVRTARGESFWDWFQPPANACPVLKNRDQGARVGGPMSQFLETIRQEDEKRARSLTTRHLPTLYDLDRWWTHLVTRECRALRNRAADGNLHNVIEAAPLVELLKRPGSRRVGTWLASRGYKLIGISGTGGAHAMALRIIPGRERTSVVFMDPNCGEFYFAEMTSFFMFFTDFWELPKGYGKTHSSFVTVTALTDPE